MRVSIYLYVFEFPYQQRRVHMVKCMFIMYASSSSKTRSNATASSFDYIPEAIRADNSGINYSSSPLQMGFVFLAIFSPHHAPLPNLLLPRSLFSLPVYCLSLPFIPTMWWSAVR